MKKGQRTTASPEQKITDPFWPMNDPDQGKTILQRLHEASINPGPVRGEVTEWSDPADPNDPEIRPLFKVRGKTFNCQEAAAAWVADQERINAMEAFLRRHGRSFTLMRLVACHEIGELIGKHPELVAQALETRCAPEALAAFPDELMLLRNGGI